MHYYNEFDPFAAQWLRNLILKGHLPRGDVDERSITEVSPDDLRPYTQCHFFAGIGGWPLALKLAGWELTRPVWTGSCPCQPFSTAGSKRGEEDERHLWPVWFRLIRQQKPSVVFGEQVASAIAHGWLDQVACDLETQNYAVGAAPLPAFAGQKGHERQRLWFVAHAQDNDDRRDTGEISRSHESQTHQRPEKRIAEFSGAGDLGESGVEWISCPDGKLRSIKSGVPLLVDGFPGRLDIQRAYGNAIVPQVAAAFIAAYEDCMP